MGAVQGRPGFAWEGGGECDACCAWEGSQGDLFAFLLTPCCLDGWHQLVHGPAVWCGMQLAVPRISPWSCSRGINHGCAAAALGAPSLLGRWLQLLLLSLLCPPLQLLQLAALPSSHCRRGDCAALGMQVIPGTFLLGRSHVLSRWQDSPGRSLGDTSVHRGSQGILDQKSL